MHVRSCVALPQQRVRSCSLALRRQTQQSCCPCCSPFWTWKSAARCRPRVAHRCPRLQLPAPAPAQQRVLTAGRHVLAVHSTQRPLCADATANAAQDRVKAGVVPLLEGLSTHLSPENRHALLERLAAGLSTYSELLYCAISAALPCVMDAAALTDAQRQSLVAGLLERVRACLGSCRTASAHDEPRCPLRSWKKGAVLRTASQLPSPRAALACWTSGVPLLRLRCA